MSSQESSKKAQSKREKDGDSDSDYVDELPPKRKRTATKKQQERDSSKHISKDRKNVPGASRGSQPGRGSAATGASKSITSKDQKQKYALKRKIERLERQLFDSQSQLFKFRTKDTLSDEEIRNKYHKLCLSIEYWTVKFLEIARVRADQNGQILKINEMHQDLESICYDHIEALEITIISIIHCELQKTVLTNDRGLVGIDGSIANLIRSIEAKQPTRADSDSTHGHWMAHLIGYVKSTPEFSEQQQKSAAMLTESIQNVLMHQISILDTRCQAFTSGIKNIVQEAISVANAIKSHPSKLRFSSDVRSPKPKILGRVYIKEFKTARFRDAETGRLLQDATKVTAAEDESFGTLLTTIEPGLFVVPKKTPIREPLMLVTLDDTSANHQRKVDRNDQETIVLEQETIVLENDST